MPKLIGGFSRQPLASRTDTMDHSLDWQSVHTSTHEAMMEATVQSLELALFLTHKKIESLKASLFAADNSFRERSADARSAKAFADSYETRSRRRPTTRKCSPCS